MKRAAFLAALVLLSVTVSGAEQGRVISAVITWNGGIYEIHSLQAALDYRTPNDSSGNYLVKLLDSEGQTLYQLKVKKPIYTNPAPEDLNAEETEEWYKYRGFSGAMLVGLPFLEEAKTLSFEHGTKVLARADLSALCNRDGKCGESENFLSCPEDCPLDEEDGYCTSGKDGICDPDCAKGIDPDCKEKGAAEEKKIEFDLIGFAIFAGTAIVILSIFLSRRGKK